MSRASFQFYSQGRTAPSELPLPRGAVRPPVVRWRLIAGNRRELGRSAQLFIDVTEGQASLRGLLAALDALHPRFDVEAATQRWRWQLQRDGETVVVSTRGYSRRVECQISLQQFLALAPAAGIDPVLRVFGAARGRGRREGRQRLPAAELAS